MDAQVSAFELEVEEGGSTRRVALARGLTRVGGAGCEVVLAGGGADQLHLWDDPPKLVFVGKGAQPRVDGRSVEEIALAGGEGIEWCGARLRLQRVGQPVLREIPLPPAAAAPLPDERAWARVRAGLQAELGLVDRGAARRWQEAVLRGEFDPDACARDLNAAGQAQPGDPRLLERTGRLLRDLLMAPYQRGLRGAGRRARGAARSGLAFLIAQVLILLVFALLFGVVLLVVHVRWGWSVDGFLDSLLDLVPS
jgi:hypothetical protein